MFKINAYSFYKKHLFKPILLHRKKELEESNIRKTSNHIIDFVQCADKNS